MARLLAVLTSARKKGYTAGLLAEAVDAARHVSGITVDSVHAFKYKFGPCNSCFACIRHPERYCNRDDDMGRQGKGELFAKVIEANGLLIAEPVHFWGSAAMTHLFVERLYPFLWHETLQGLPFASISCASNQGMMRIANSELARWAFTLKLRYIEGLPVHTVYYGEARRHARYIGEKLAQAALQDEREGRHHPSDEESWFYYMDKPWNALREYIENLTQGTFRWEESLIEYALTQETIKRPDARVLLEEARSFMIKTINAWNLHDYVEAQRNLIEASARWTHATFKEFGEQQIVRAPIPATYRPLPLQKGGAESAERRANGKGGMQGEQGRID